MYHIDQKFDGTDQGYQSHQLLTESRVEETNDTNKERSNPMSRSVPLKKNAQLLTYFLACSKRLTKRIFKLPHHQATELQAQTRKEMNFEILQTHS